MSFEGAIGIHFGCDNSCVAVCEGEVVTVMTNKNGCRITPSYICYSKRGIEVGDNAKFSSLFDIKHTIYDINWLLGRKISDEVVLNKIKELPFEVCEGFNNSPRIVFNVNGIRNVLRVEEIAGEIMEYLRRMTQEYIGKWIGKVVISVPLNYNETQREAVKSAAYDAGFTHNELIDDPIAAAVAYGLDKNLCDNKERYILVYNLGGSFFNVSVLYKREEVLIPVVTSGTINIGGRKFDERMADYFVEVAKQRFPDRKVFDHYRSYHRLCRACEMIKEKLTVDNQASLHDKLEFPDVDFVVNIDRNKFEELCDDLFRKTIEVTSKVLEKSKVSKSSINEILLVGGSTRIPKVQTLLSQFFDGKKLRQEINVDEVLACGAAIRAKTQAIKWNLPKPESTLRDKVLYTVGVKTERNHMNIIVYHFMPVPIIRKEIFSTSVDDQQSVQIQIYKGRKKSASKCRLIGTLELTGILPGPRGLPKIEVGFEVDADGILTVYALDKITGNFNNTTITNMKGVKTEDKTMSLARRPEESVIQERVKKYIENTRLEFSSDINSVKNSLLSTEKASVLNKAGCNALLSLIKQEEEWLNNNEGATIKDYAIHWVGFEDNRNAITTDSKYQNNAAQTVSEDDDTIVTSKPSNNDA